MAQNDDRRKRELETPDTTEHTVERRALLDLRRWQIRPNHLYKAVGLFFLLLFFYRYFDVVSQVLLLIYASAIVAVALNPVAKHVPIERRWIAAIVAVLSFSVLGTVVFFGTLLLIDQVRGIIEVLPELEERMIGWIIALEQVTGLNLAALRTDPFEEIGNFLANALSTELLGRAPAVLSAIFVPLIILIGGLFALARPNRSLLEPLMRAVPKDRRPVYYRMMSLLGARLLGWVRGTLLAMLGVGILATIALYLLGVQYALALGIFMGICEFVPIIGPWVGGVPAVLIAFLDDPMKGVWTMIAIVAVQLIESNLITPWAMSSQANVHPVITLFALVFFGGVFGFLGILLSIPLVLLFGTIIEVLWIETTVNTDADYIPPVAEE